MSKSKLAFYIFAGFIGIFVIAGATRLWADTTVEYNTDRWGSDYNNFELQTPDPQLCRQACEADERCRAYSYVKPGVQLSNAVCYLKSTAPRPSKNSCCVSGEKTESQRIESMMTTEYNTDRWGSDYNRFEQETPDPQLCRQACEADARCEAYTYVKPGIQASNAVCYLKNPAPGPTQNPCCVSGVKQK
ncbi:MAG: apple domain-containing protein [Syntrophus sp. (in: bacteria)]|nr:apple domain-containing protein [Syntrophus sp. (in: bacteria)]